MPGFERREAGGHPRQFPRRHGAQGQVSHHSCRSQLSSARQCHGYMVVRPSAFAGAGRRPLPRVALNIERGDWPMKMVIIRHVQRSLHLAGWKGSDGSRISASSDVQTCRWRIWSVAVLGDNLASQKGLIWLTRPTRSL